MLKAVSNSGPFIHLNEINQLSLFSIFDEIVIPNSVVSEIGKFRLKNIKIIRVNENDVKNFTETVRQFNLHKAEIDALYLAKKFVAIFLTDDLRAREAAKKLNIEVHGSLGIIALCYKKGIMDLKKTKEEINNLYDKSTLFLTKSLVELAILKLEKSK